MSGILAINLQPGVDFFENITFMGDGMILLNACCGAVGGVVTRVVSNEVAVFYCGGHGGWWDLFGESGRREHLTKKGCYCGIGILKMNK